MGERECIRGALDGFGGGKGARIVSAGGRQNLGLLQAPQENVQRDGTAAGVLKCQAAGERIVRSENALLLDPQAGAPLDGVEQGQAVGGPAAQSTAERQWFAAFIQQKQAVEAFQANIGEIGLVPETGRVEMFREGGRIQRRFAASQKPFVGTLQQRERIETDLHNASSCASAQQGMQQERCPRRRSLDAKRPSEGIYSIAFETGLHMSSLSPLWGNVEFGIACKYLNQVDLPDMIGHIAQRHHDEVRAKKLSARMLIHPAQILLGHRPNRGSKFHSARPYLLLCFRSTRENESRA